MTCNVEPADLSFRACVRVGRKYPYRYWRFALSAKTTMHACENLANQSTQIITYFDVVFSGQCNDLANAYCCFKAMDAQSTGNNPSCRSQCNNECTKQAPRRRVGCSDLKCVM